jgi:hypothetical protein
MSFDDKKVLIYKNIFILQDRMDLFNLEEGELKTVFF